MSARRVTRRLTAHAQPEPAINLLPLTRDKWPGRPPCWIYFPLDTSTPLSHIFYGVSELSRRKLSPTLATAHYSCRGNAVGLLVQCEPSGYVKLG